MTHTQIYTVANDIAYAHAGFHGVELRQQIEDAIRTAVSQAYEEAAEAAGAEAEKWGDETDAAKAGAHACRGVAREIRALKDSLSPETVSSAS